MVKLKEIEASNDQVRRNGTKGLVCIFAGATSNLGAGTLQQMATIVHDSTFYVLGRSEARFQSQRQTLESSNATLNIVLIETDVTLIAGVDRACELIRKAETKVDYLFMSQGSIPICIPRYTKEGIDTCFALSYFSRIRLITNLLSLLRHSSRPRVLSVLAGGREEPILESDIGLEDPKNYAQRPTMNHTTTMTSLSMSILAKAKANEHVTFMHAFPGLVRSDNFARLTAPPEYSVLRSIGIWFMTRLVSWVQFLFGMSASDCGARQAYLLTSDTFGPGRLWRINEKSEVVGGSELLVRYENDGVADRVWEYTLGVFERVNGTSK